MAAYIVAQVKVRDPAAYQRYREAVTPLVDRFGGRFRVRGGELDVLEGDWAWPRLVIIEFQSKDAARLFYESPEYQQDPAAAAGSVRWHGGHRRERLSRRRRAIDPQSGSRTCDRTERAAPSITAAAWVARTQG